MLYLTYTNIYIYIYIYIYLYILYKFPLWRVFFFSRSTLFHKHLLHPLNPVEMVNAYVDPALRVLLLIFLVISMALLGSLIESQFHVNPQINFGIFSTAFGILIGVFYGLAAGFIESLAFPIVLFVIDLLNFIFTFAAACAIAAAIRCHSCSNKHYIDNNTVAQGSEGRCRKAQASVAFLFFSCAIIIAQLVMSGTTLFSAGPFSLPSRKRAPARTGLPTMSQV